MGEPGARAALSTFYQKCRSALPDYDCEHQKSVNQWSCTVSCVAVSINGRDVPDIFQTASAQNKKGAMNAAAKLALDELKTTEAYLSLQPPSNLWDVVQQALNDKVCSLYVIGLTCTVQLSSAIWSKGRADTEDQAQP